MGILNEKSKRFAVRIVRLYQYLCREKQEHVMSRQLLRCGTSIGANLAEAKCSISRNDFAAKTYIALKEAAETMYWLDLLHETEYLSDTAYLSIYHDAEEIRKMLSATTKTLRQSSSSLSTLNSPR